MPCCRTQPWPRRCGQADRHRWTVAGAPGSRRWFLPDRVHRQGEAVEAARHGAISGRFSGDLLYTAPGMPSTKSGIHRQERGCGFARAGRTTRNPVLEEDIIPTDCAGAWLATTSRRRVLDRLCPSRALARRTSGLPNGVRRLPWSPRPGRLARRPAVPRVIRDSPGQLVWWVNGPGTRRAC